MTTKKPKYYTAYNTPETEPAPTGSKTEPVYEMTINLKGHKVLKKTGETNIYDIIQEGLEESKIENIIRRATEGDAYALNTMNGQYMDITDVPKSLAEAQNFVIQAKNEFDQLPINIRRQFDMSAEAYIAQYGTSEWLDKLGILENKKTPEKANNEATEASEKGGNKE